MLYKLFFSLFYGFGHYFENILQCNGSVNFENLFINYKTYQKMKKINNPFRCENLGNGRVKFSVIINFKLLGVILALLLGLALAGFTIYWLGVGVVALAKLIWSIKWWLLGAILFGLLIWLLTKVNWKAINLPERKPREDKERNLGWLWAVLGLIAIILLGALLFKGCDREEKPVATVTEEVTEERFKEPGDWVMLDAYLSEAFNVKYADFKKFDSYGKVLSYDERLQAFDTEAYYADWGRLFPYFEGKRFNDNQLAALKRYGLWCGLAGFEKSPVCQKLQNGEEVLASDLAVIYTAEGKERQYSRASSKEHAKKYAWILMNVFDGNITIDELLNCPVKSFEKLAVEDMYDAEGNYIFYPELKTKLMQQNGNRTTREVLGL